MGQCTISMGVGLMLRKKTTTTSRYSFHNLKWELKLIISAFLIFHFFCSLRILMASDLNSNVITKRMNHNDDFDFIISSIVSTMTCILSLLLFFYEKVEIKTNYECCGFLDRFTETHSFEKDSIFVCVVNCFGIRKMIKS